jgi:hypothetical protein
MRSPSSDPRPALGLALVVLLLAGDSPALAQATKVDPAKASGVFDEDKPAKPASPAEMAAAKTPTPAVDRESLGFTQDNAAAQMGELEDRMFRLSEALRGLEPENASRLRLALKFSKEELILEQMREVNKMLKEAQLNRAETEVRELLAKLQHLRDVLLAEDLDFQLRLARLRQVRESLGQLDRVIKEEQRELGWSRFAIDQRKARERLAARRPDLEALERDQKAVLADTRGISPSTELEARKTAARAVREREAGLRKSTAALANDPLFAEFQPSELRKADTLLGDAVARLEAGEMTEAVAAEEGAGRVLKEELDRLDGRIAEADRDVADAEFRRHEADQIQNRKAAEALGAGSTRLGDAGVPLQKDLIRSSAVMQLAEKELARSAAPPASEHQSAALDILVKSRDELLEAAERLLVVLRTELQARMINEITELHESQMSIRETTQAQVPRLAQKSRSAMITMAGLSQKETALATSAEQLLALVEETEFGIALPTTLRVLGREMHSIEGWLKDGDASPRTIGFEQRVEDDLLALLGSVRRLPPTTPPPPGTPLPTEPRERERELNRLIAELKMVRMLQARLNDDTSGLDKNRPGAPALPPQLRRELESLEAGQDEIRDALAKIAERLPQP